MNDDFPPLYRCSRADAVAMNEEEKWWASFRSNVECARDIEKAINMFYDEGAEQFGSGCAEAVLEKWGFHRTRFVIANTLKEELPQYLCQFSQENQEWGSQPYVPPDGKHNRYFAVDRGIALTDAFITQAREAYQALGLFEAKQCDPSSLDYTGRVLLLKASVLKESCLIPQNQLWYAEHGFGCSPTASGRAVFATCLGDGERARWNRADFSGVLKDEFLPDWAREKLQELQAPKQDSPAMGGMS